MRPAFIVLLFSTLISIQCSPSMLNLYQGEGALVVSACHESQYDLSDVPHIMRKPGPSLPTLKVINPLDGAVFPQDMPAPRFEWSDAHYHSVNWVITFSSDVLDALYIVTDRQRWTPEPWQWDRVKIGAGEKHLRVEIRGFSRDLEPVSSAIFSLRFSKDPVEAALFYLEMPLPFSFGERHPETLRWKIGDPVSSAPPRVVAQGLPTCSNCHSVSRDGRLLGVDMDIDGDKGGYVLVRTERDTVVSRPDLVSWNSFTGPSGRKSMGLFSKISPDGRYVASTVWEHSFFAYLDDVWYSQFFFPIRGVIAVYDIEKKSFQTLGGADDEMFVQTCPDWHPDGQSLVFARAKPAPSLFKALGDRKVLPTSPGDRIQALNKIHKLHFNLYRSPFGQGGGGRAQPLNGASHNGFSNYFPRHSPDGRWIVFTRSPNGLAIQPESELWIVPAAGGEARRMRCNLSPMNSWHSWSPNGRWLVFSSKARGPHTQLYLTHVDREGQDSPPVLLSRFSSPGYACMVPELVNPGLLQVRSITLGQDIEDSR
ncbi:MAG: PD40 domain-containing protein [Desulfosarcina sp.]|nr:PD40 domain-containing protein [Desulfobacterales bacterium]